MERIVKVIYQEKRCEIVDDVRKLTNPGDFWDWAYRTGVYQSRLDILEYIFIGANEKEDGSGAYYNEARQGWYCFGSKMNTEFWPRMVLQDAVLVKSVESRLGRHLEGTSWI
jgi:hypothetical protein